MYRGKNISLNFCQHFVGLNSERRGIFLAAVIDCKLARKNEICSLRGRHKKGGGGGGGEKHVNPNLSLQSPCFFPLPLSTHAMQVRNLRHAIARNNLPRPPKFLDIHHFHQDHNAPCLTPRILHNHCKMWGVNKEHYGEFWQLEATMASSCGFWCSIHWQYPEVFLKMIFVKLFEGACLEFFFYGF